MRRLDRGPSRRERRAAAKGIPRGRRATRKVQTTYGRHQRDRDWRAAMDATREAFRQQHEMAATQAARGD